MHKIAQVQRHVVHLNEILHIAKDRITHNKSGTDNQFRTHDQVFDLFKDKEWYESNLYFNRNLLHLFQSSILFFNSCTL